MSQAIADFSAEQIKVVQSIVDTRYGNEVELHLGDSEIQLDSKKAETIVCPVIFWNARACNFVVIRIGESQYRAHFFYNPNKQFSTIQTEFNDVEEIVNSILREQADFERESNGVKSGATADDLNQKA